MKGLRQQAGASFYLIILAVGMGIFILTIAIKVGPYYLDYYTIKGVIERVVAEPGAKKMSLKSLRDKVDQRLIMNNIRYLKVGDAIKLKKEKGVTTVLLNYDVEGQLFSNDFSSVNFVTNFHQDIPTTGN